MKLLPKIVGDHLTFAIHAHQGKNDLLGKLGSKLCAHSRWIQEDYRILVLVDRDNEDCEGLKRRLESVAITAGFPTPNGILHGAWRTVNRIAIEEIEAWYFGNWEAVRAAYPRVGANIPNQSAYRRPNAIQGGTWEALERVLKRFGYFVGGIRKIELAMQVGTHFDPAMCRSPSFVAFRDAILKAIQPVA